MTSIGSAIVIQKFEIFCSGNEVLVVKFRNLLQQKYNCGPEIFIFCSGSAVLVKVLKTFTVDVLLRSRNIEICFSGSEVLVEKF